ncbi:C39 family peptidase [Domibacillus indicus]|uniref:C39 family peptidase n=1 Tax=Domibacillus indicus TaxID=1437523 RepID=UPI000617C22E|nr:C39 family peptidase [Domibacillus indicus]
MIQVKGQSQYGVNIKEKYRSSACGPVTFSVILQYWNKPYSANQLYKQLWTTRLGSSRFVMIRRLRKLLGKSWVVSSSNRIDEVTNELKQGHPVAAKFDKYFSFRFLLKPMYAYHWVVLVGYKIKNGSIYLYFHDNGAPGRKSRLRCVSYEEQAQVLRFVLLHPKNPRSKTGDRD